MDHSNGDRTPDDLVSLAERLRSERPVPSALELDRIKLRARRQTTQAMPTPRLKGQWMKSRLALTLMIALGLMTSGTGATLAITGSSGSGSAAHQQYDAVQPQENNDNPQVLGDQDEGGDQSPDEDVSPVSDTEQVAVAGDSSDSLPFTGFFTIPLILGGVALLSTGVFLRRRIDR